MKRLPSRKPENRTNQTVRPPARPVDEDVARRVAALFDLLARICGPDRLVLRAGKLDALHLMRSADICQRVLALERLVHQDPTLDDLPEPAGLPAILGELEDALAEQLAKKSLEDSLEKKVADRMQARQQEYLKELRLQVLKEDAAPDNARTLRKYAELEKLEQRNLARSAVEALRPRQITDVVGQDRAVKALLAKIASPFPQHVILYGPPGVGKTTVARLVLERAKMLDFTPFRDDARFVEVDGATLRWDPREVSNPLLGSVHDPIYQGARRELADSAVPEPKPGLVTQAHGGVLFIDEIGEMDLMLQTKLLKVLEDRRVYFESAYYDPADPHVPKYIRKLFEEGAPADFVLIGATTRDPSELNPALRSRCAEVFFDPLTPADVQKIVAQAAGRLGVALDEDVPALISEYTIEGRKAIGILADAYGLSLYRLRGLDGGDVPAPRSRARGRKNGARAKIRITAQDVGEVATVGRLTHHLRTRGRDAREVGRILGLGVRGFVGSVLEIEAVAFPARESGRGTVRFNETAGKMARDSVFNAASVVRKVAAIDLADWDVHVNVVGGGNIDGPSAGAAVLTAIISAVQERPLRQDVAVTGEISIQGRVKEVGGLHAKLYGARQAGIRRVIIPAENASEVPRVPGLEVVPVDRVEDMLEHVF